MELVLLQGSYILVGISIILALVILGLLNLVTNTKNKEIDYLKSGFIAGITTGLVVYIHKLTPIVQEIVSNNVAPF